jgi:hypothetical protein
MAAMKRIVAVAAVVGAVLVVLVIAARLILWPEPQVPAITADSLPVIGVSAAIEARDRLDETVPVAVFGWFSYFGAHSCTAPDSAAIPGELEMRCHRGEMVLAERPESGVEVEEEGGNITTARTRRLDGPWLDPHVSSLATDRQIHPGAMRPWTPITVVAVGHFRDHRASDCQPKEMTFCLRVFVMDHIAAVAGVDRPAVRLINDEQGTPRSDPWAITRAVEDRLGPRSLVLAVAYVRSKDVSNYEDRADPPTNQRMVWLVRAITRGPDGTAAPRLKSMLIDDITEDVIWESQLPNG